MNVKKLKKNKKGFTLVEIIVVLVIIGILMALAVPAVMKYMGDAADTKVEAQVRAGFITAQARGADYVGNNPGASDDSIAGDLTKANINTELGLADSDDGAISSITCTVTDKKVASCDIVVVGSDYHYTASQGKIVKGNKVTTPGA